MYKTVLTEPRASDNENFDDIMKQYYKVIEQGSVQGLFVLVFYNACQEFVWKCILNAV
jgi:hypothetical protein